jgi:hypothetical protein
MVKKIHTHIYTYIRTYMHTYIHNHKYTCVTRIVTFVAFVCGNKKEK